MNECVNEDVLPWTHTCCEEGTSAWADVPQSCFRRRSWSLLQGWSCGYLSHGCHPVSSSHGSLGQAGDHLHPSLFDSQSWVSMGLGTVRSDPWTSSRSSRSSPRTESLPLHSLLGHFPGGWVSPCVGPSSPG